MLLMALGTHSKPRVLVIGAASDRRDELELELRRAGFCTLSSALDSEALDSVQRLMPDAILLLLPEGRAGSAFLRFLRLSDYRGPLLLLGSETPAALPSSLYVPVLIAGWARVTEVIETVRRLTLRSQEPAARNGVRHYSLPQDKDKRPSGPATLLTFRRA